MRRYSRGFRQIERQQKAANQGAQTIACGHRAAGVMLVSIPQPN